MSKIIRIESPLEPNMIQLSDNWIDATASSKQSVEENGRQYCLIKKERPFPWHERLARIFLGIAALFFSLGGALFCKSIRNLFTKNKQTLRFQVLPKSLEFLKFEVLDKGKATNLTSESLAKELELSPAAAQTYAATLDLIEKKYQETNKLKQEANLTASKTLPKTT